MVLVTDRLRERILPKDKMAKNGVKLDTKCVGKSEQDAFNWNNKGVALTGRNTTGPPCSVTMEL